MIFIDESHQTVPQVRGCITATVTQRGAGGFRFRRHRRSTIAVELPGMGSAHRSNVFVSATPSEYDCAAPGSRREQIIRPTGIDPPIEVRRPRPGGDLLQEIRVRADKRERVLVTTLTKRMAEDLTQFIRSSASG